MSREIFGLLSLLGRTLQGTPRPNRGFLGLNEEKQGPVVCVCGHGTPCLAKRQEKRESVASLGVRLLGRETTKQESEKVKEMAVVFGVRRRGTKSIYR